MFLKPAVITPTVLDTAFYICSNIILSMLAQYFLWSSLKPPPVHCLSFQWRQCLAPHPTLEAVSPSRMLVFCCVRNPGPTCEQREEREERKPETVLSRAHGRGLSSIAFPGHMVGLISLPALVRPTKKTTLNL